jgi:hypothetical protein
LVNKKQITSIDVAVALENRTAGAVDIAHRVVRTYVHTLPPVEKKKR